MSSLLERLVASRKHKSHSMVVEGLEKREARELEKQGLAEFVDLYHGDHYWTATPLAVEQIRKAR